MDDDKGKFGRFNCELAANDNATTTHRVREISLDTANYGAQMQAPCASECECKRFSLPRPFSLSLSLSPGNEKQAAAREEKKFSRRFNFGF